MAQDFPLIHAVGRAAAARAPRLIDIAWGDAGAPRVTLVGKGVCFDSGGLDIKPDSAMLLMKKDMGGAATVLALAQMIMDRKLNMRLRVLIPAVENADLGQGLPPARRCPLAQGPAVEVGNTDAEGRLILADALALADEEKPGAAGRHGHADGRRAGRARAGPAAVLYRRRNARGAVSPSCGGENDPLWRLPLWRPYDPMLNSKVADLNNVATGGFAGSIICALFLNRFVSAAKAWLHLDIYAWTPVRQARPARRAANARRRARCTRCSRSATADDHRASIRASRRRGRILPLAISLAA